MMRRSERALSMLIKTKKIPLRDIILVGWMPSILKVWFYRLRGYAIGKDVKIGLFSVVSGKDVELCNEVKIGSFTVIRGNKVSLGPRVRIGSFSFIDTYQISIGEGTRINNQVVVGGLQTPSSSFKMGRNCILMEWSFINTSMPVTIGDDVGIGGHCLFFTHGLWPSGFEGFPVNFGPITIDDRAWLAWRVSVLPGAKIGQETIVSTDACVIGELPAQVLAGGVPAKTLRANGTFMRPHDRTSNCVRLQRWLSDFGAWLEFHGFRVDKSREGALCIKDKSERRQYTIITRHNEDDDLISRIGSLHPATGVVISLCMLNNSEREALDTAKLPWFDIAAKHRSRQENELSQETEEFFRREGHRFLKYNVD